MWLWLAGITGALITSLYTFRMIFLTFFGELKIQPKHKPGLLMTIPFIVLASLSLLGGFIELPENLGPLHLFSTLLHPIFPNAIHLNEDAPEWLFQAISAHYCSRRSLYGLTYFFIKKLKFLNPSLTIVG